MSGFPYATQDDLTDGNWLISGQLPSAVTRYLRSASFLVARATYQNPYDSGSASPDALRDATCAQVTSWALMGVDPAQQGTDIRGPVKSSTILDGKVDRDTSAAVKAATDAVSDLCDEAQAILFAAGLLTDDLGEFEIASGPVCWPEATERPYSCSPDESVLGGGQFGDFDQRFDSLDSNLETIQETLMAFSPLSGDVTKISGAPVVIASSTTSAALTLGRQHLVTGSAVQPVTVPTPTVDGTIVSIKVADGSTASVTLPAALQVSGVTSMSAGQDYDWFWSTASSTWSIE